MIQEPVNNKIQQINVKKNQETLSYVKFKAFQIQREICYSYLFFNDFFQTFDKNLTPLVQHQLHQTDPQAHHKSSNMVTGFNKTLEYIKNYQFLDVHDNEIICPQCSVRIYDFKKQMVGFLTGVKIGSAPYEARRINRTKLLLRKMIETQAEEFMDQCLAKDTENSI